MRKGGGFTAGLLWLLLLLPVAGTASATIYEGCYVCQAIGRGGASYCRPVGHGEHGDGTRCEEEESLSGPFGPWCSMTPNPCYNVDVSGGGGGGGGGSGGGNACLTVGFCPAECFSCAGGGRPAV